MIFDSHMMNVREKRVDAQSKKTVPYLEKSVNNEFFFILEFHRHTALSLAIPSVRCCTFLSSLPRHLPDQALGPKPAMELRIEALAAVVDVETLAALLAESCLVLLADRNCVPVRMALTLHCLYPRAF